MKDRIWKTVVALTAGAAFTLASLLCVFALNAPAPVFATATGNSIVLDAGHGGVDGGVTGRTTGVKESELNLSITYALKTALEEAGFAVTLTRKTDEGLYGAATNGFKKRDMQKRKEIIEEARPAAVISIHQNYYPSRTVRGGQAFYDSTSETGKRLAESVQEELNGLYGKRGVKNRLAAKGEYYILSCTSYPSVIVECGFLSNAEDEKLLLSKNFQKEIAEGVCRALVCVFGV